MTLCSTEARPLTEKIRHFLPLAPARGISARVLRLLHTSDWHLGHSLHDLPRRFEHSRFLAWLLDQLEAEEIDALVVAGDIFDTVNPSAEAQQAFYDFLAEARQRMAGLDIVLIGGNHDSAARLDAPDPVLRALGIRVVGGLPREGRNIREDRLIVPLHLRSGAVGAWLAAVPFLRAFDLPLVKVEARAEGEDEAEPVDVLVEGVRQIYADATSAARARRRPGQALLAVGHCYMTGTELSELSERKILGGNQHALPIDIFPEDLAYVALGHLHRAQTVGGREGIRYSGSPIPLSLSEASYRHQVCVVDIDGERLARVRGLPVPRATPILKIPEDRPRPLDEVLPLLEALPPLTPDTIPGARPFLEVQVAMPRPEPSMRRRVEEAMDGKAARLVRIGVEFAGSGLALGDVYAKESLSELSPEQVFRKCYGRKFPDEPAPELLADFADLLHRVHAREP